MKTWTRLLFSATALTTVALAAPALAADLDQKVAFNIAPGSLDEALLAYSKQADLQVISASSAVRGKRTPGLAGAVTPREALAMLLQDSGLSFVATSPSTVTVTQGERAGGGSSAGATVDALIVTAQKREEDIQDVPIAISAFSQERLEAEKIEGGFDLLKAIPNVSFSKNNFTSYNFSIRGIGTKAVSATTDPGVAVSFNNIALLQNRLFEQEYFDVERVEVLRGPQGTLYGRNATAGVINVLSAKPDLDEFDGWVKAEVGNYASKRMSGMLNIPLVDDKLGIRFAGAMTQRDGYDFNALTDNAVNGRDLWSTRVTVGFEPTERVRGDLVWEHFEEDDNRSRTGKQLCHRDPGLTEINGIQLWRDDGRADDWESVMRPATFSQGCLPGNMYDDAAFGTPNGLALPLVFGMLALSSDCGVGCPGSLFSIGVDPLTGRNVGLLTLRDPYASARQSTDLRRIESIRDPVYRGKADVLQLNLEFDLSESLTFYSQTAYNEDEVYSFQDFNRFNTQPIFNDTSELLGINPFLNGNVSPWRPLAPRPAGSPVGTPGVFCDPQLGCSDRLASFDISQGVAEQFTQEFRLQSNSDGPLNFSAGANYTHFDVLVDYYVFANLATAYALQGPFNGVPSTEPAGVFIDPTRCGLGGGFTGSDSWVDIMDPLSICPYIDLNPIESIDGQGHNYFRSKNPYTLKSSAAFGELYWQATDALKVTAGIRYTYDEKRFIPVKSQMLSSQGFLSGGAVNYGYPEEPPIDQHWGEFTGRFGFDWKAALPFTDETMLYAFYSRGYKGGGANPPTPGFATIQDYLDQAELFGAAPGGEFVPFLIDLLLDMEALPVLNLTAVEYSRTFEPEFVDAFEVGSKNTLLGGALTFNTGAFFYDYKDYQVSQIRDRSAVNENFDATVWGLEFETRFAPSRNFQLIANLGYLDTKIGDGESSIDIMDRTAGHEDFVVAKSWFQLPSNCVVPKDVVTDWVQVQSTENPAWAQNYALHGYMFLCGGINGFVGTVERQAGFAPIDPATGLEYTPLIYDGTNGFPDINGGAGFRKDLSGNELPNSPHWTTNIGAQYAIDMDAWKVTFRGDAYWQSQSWARVYNSDPYDKLHGWYNVNLAVWLEIPEHDLKVEFYAKNVLDKTPITDAFLNSDDTALTTNVFVLDPRLLGLSIRKGF